MLDNYSSRDLDLDEIDVELLKKGIEADNVEDLKEEYKVENLNEEDEVDDPKVGMEFISLDEIYGFYSRYARKHSFSVFKRNVKRGPNGEFKYLTLSCTHGGKSKVNTKNPAKMRPQTKIECKAGLNAVCGSNGTWKLSSIILNHNHKMSPSKSRFFKSNRVLNSYVKRRLEINDMAGNRINKNFTSLLVEGGGGYEGLGFSEQDFEEFEENWGSFMKKYELEGNEWLLALYDERHRWVPTFVKDIFWAGMLTTQRSESINSFFDGYINSKTTLKQFVEQYEPALAKNVENENKADSSSLHSYIPCFSKFELEQQFQSAYTISKFKDVQKELVEMVYCNLCLSEEGDGISEYEVREDVLFGENRRRVTFKVWFKENGSEANCNCRLFEFRGILCKHCIIVFLENGIYRLPERYILRRWSKTIRRSHSKVQIRYKKSTSKVEACRYDNMCNEFFELAELARNSEESNDVGNEIVEHVGLGTQDTSHLYDNSAQQSQYIGGMGPFPSNVAHSMHPYQSSLFTQGNFPFQPNMLQGGFFAYQPNILERRQPFQFFSMLEEKHRRLH
ncbi:hypothetical protein Acr_00g0014800 [Actinidia rufa]|uniref:Protein FAR1-RELATED SEQUENCE n=1 Tax=Actinidia rufa TaxID=165716 RepID=A0A7J0DAE2_9ERIC|nr:hypothetical protein Acr_00g0014800 [Actinidia rufa]